MDRLKALSESRRTALVNATKRATEAESTTKEKEQILKKKTEEASKLEKRLILTRDASRSMKELLVALQQLDEAKKKLVVSTEKADQLGVKVNSLHDEADRFESQFQTTKKKYYDLISEMDHLGIN